MKCWENSDDGKYLMELVYDHVPEAMLTLFNEGICVREDGHQAETEKLSVEFDFK